MIGGTVLGISSIALMITTTVHLPTSTNTKHKLTYYNITLYVVVVVVVVLPSGMVLS